MVEMVTAGVGGLSTGGRGCQYSPLVSPPPPPPQGPIDGPPQNATETDPRTPEVIRTQNSAKNENGIFGISASAGSGNSSFAMYLVKKIDHFQCSKKFSAPEFKIND